MKIFLFLLAMFIFAVPANAARIELKNGDRITGRWIDSNTATARFESSYGSIVRIPRGEIAALYDDGGVAIDVPLPDGEVLPQQATAAQKIEEPKNTFIGATWKSRVNAGAGLQTGNTDQKTFNADFETRGKWDKDRANLDIDYNWEENDGDKTTDNREISGNFDRFLPPSALGDDKWYVNFNADARQDKIADLDLRSVLGVGLGRQFYETEETYLSASLGPSWLREDYGTGETDSDLAARWNIDYDQKFYDNLFSLFHKHSLYLPVNGLSDYIFDAESGLRIPIRDGFSLTGEWQLDIDRDPAEGSDTTDSIYSLKLGYEW